MLKSVLAAVPALGLLALAGAANAQPARVGGAACGPLAASAQDNATEPKSGRTFFIEYPCGLKADDKVTVILNLHGGGSFGTYQRRYFPAGDYVQANKLVVVTPTAATATPVRMWVAAADDAYLHDLTDFVISSFGKKNVRAFWLAGHSQGGATSSRVICSAFFKDKVDGFLSLSGGRQGGAATLSGNFYRADQLPAGQKADPAVAPARPRAPSTTPPAAPAADGPATCDYSHIFSIGQYEIEPIPETSAIAEKFGCKVRQRRPGIVDDKAGYVNDPGRQNPATLGWGRQARPGKAELYVWQGCKDDRVVADVVRLDKGHTEGLEPKVTQQIVQLITSARGGRLNR